MEKIRVGIIGAGGIAAKLHLPELAEIAEVEIVVLGGRKQSRLKRLSELFGVPHTTDSYDEILSDKSIDAVVIALPHPLHVSFGLTALAEGKHVFMQKPLSTSFEEADQFVEAVDSSDRVVFALPYVSKPHVLAARKMVEDGSLGVVSSATARFSHGGPEVYYATIQEILQEEPENELWFFDAEHAEVGALFDMGVYAIAHLVAILGSVKSVSCRMTTMHKPTQLEDTATAILEFESGALGTAETGWCDGARTYGFSIHGSESKVVNPSLTGDLIHLRPSSKVDEDAPLLESKLDLSAFPNISGHQHWIDCIQQGCQPPISNVYFARHVTEVLLKCLESAHRRCVVDVQSRLQ